MADDNRDPFTMRSDGTRNASGYVLHGRQPEAPQGRDYARDDYSTQEQDADKNKSTPGTYNHPHIGGRGVW